MPITLYELAGADPALRFSPFCWKTRMALAHKGLDYEGVPWRFTEKAAIAFADSERVPVLVDDGKSISDSWQIALYLEERFADRPSLFGGGHGIALTAFVNAFTDATVMPAIARIILLDILDRLSDEDRVYFRESREKRFGKTLEEVVANRPAHMAHLVQALAPLRHVLKSSHYIAGAAPTYADYSVFGAFMWARCVSPTELLQTDDPIFPWRERMLDAFGGLARSAPSAQNGT